MSNIIDETLNFIYIYISRTYKLDLPLKRDTRQKLYSKINEKEDNKFEVRIHFDDKIIFK